MVVSYMQPKIPAISGPLTQPEIPGIHIRKDGNGNMEMYGNIWDNRKFIAMF